jgi:integrase
MRRNLTPKTIDALKAPPAGQRVDVMDAIVPGFGVRITDKGSRSYILVARYPGSKNPTRRRIADVRAADLADARQTARSWLEIINRGIDPRDEIDRLRRAAEQERLKSTKKMTLADVLDDYERDHLSSLRRGNATRRALDGQQGLLRQFRDREISTITRPEIRQALKSRAAVAPISANRQLAYARAFFNWCRAEELVAENPTEAIRKPSKENERDRWHDLGELREIWAAAGNLGYPFGQFIRLMIVLPNRRDEVASIRLDELELTDERFPGDSIWTLPSARTKNGQPLRVPLPPLARAILLEAISHPARPKESPFVFTTTGKTAISGFSKAKARLDELIDRSRIEAS